MKLYTRNQRSKYVGDYDETVVTYEPATIDSLREAATELGMVLIPMQPTEDLLAAGNFRREFSYPRKGMMVTEYRWDYEAYEALITVLEQAKGV